MISTALGGDIGFIEDFALARDRTAALKQLIPGTEEYYYYHALHALNSGQFEQTRSYLLPWRARFGQTARLTQIETRLALLSYEENPKASLDYLRQHLGLRFDHEKQISDRVPELPTRLDPKLITWETLRQKALETRQNLDLFEDRALDRLAAEQLSPVRRRNLLQRLTRPDLPNLVDLIKTDLEFRDSGGFGSLTIHRQLTARQLETLLQQKPDLLNQTNFVNTWLAKLRPGADDNWRHDPARTNAYLERLLGWTRRLDATHNSLKAHVLYHKLVLDRSLGRYDKGLFLEYLRLPRQQPYMARQVLESDEARRFPCDLRADFSAETLLKPIVSDEPLVRAYLQHFLVDADSPQEFAGLINDQYLKHLFAETKVTAGVGEPERWASDLPPDLFAQLKERIDIDFDPTNKSQYESDAPITLKLHVKNVPTLIMKVFEINAFNFYRDQRREVDTDVNLDGLVPNFEQTFTFSEPPLRRVAREFNLPQLNKPGIYVVDFIGAGRSSRALIRKGRLRPLTTLGTAGQVVHIVDEKNQLVKDATIWLGNTEYTPEADGSILIPFSTAPERQPIILRRGPFASLDFLEHQSEQYELVAGIHIDREQLLAHRLARVLVRPSLQLNGQPVSLKLLEDVHLRLVGTDVDGVSTTTNVGNFPIDEGRESVHEFRVPPRLVKLEVKLSAKVKSLSQNKMVDLSDSRDFSLNGILSTTKIESAHLIPTAAGYVLDLLGRSGEPLANRPVALEFKHRDFKEAVAVTLRTDERGRIELGPLPEIDTIHVDQRTLRLPRDRHSYRPVLHVAAGQAVRLPWLGQELNRLTVSLLETNGTFVADHFDQLKIVDGMLEIAGLPPGDYSLYLKETDEEITLRVVQGPVAAGYVLGAVRHLQMPRLAPLQIAEVRAEDASISIRAVNATPFARVHVIATRYLPKYSAFADLGRVKAGPLGGVLPGVAESVYLTGRNIGDEYRYVLDRKYETKYPGNMLERPQLLLNPWAVRETETGEQLAREGGAFGGMGLATPSRPSASAASPPQKPQAQSGPVVPVSVCLDFLAEGSILLANQPLDAEGRLVIPRAALGAHQFVTVVAVDPESTTVRQLALAENRQQPLDLRLREGFKPDGHFALQKQVTVLEPGKPFILKDAAASRFEAYDSLPKLYQLMSTLVSDSNMAEFAFITRWHQLIPEEKRELYSKHACHELNFFLFKKDPDFFQQVVKPYLANKRDQTFLDSWLLEADLSAFVEPWRYSRLNIAERALLGQRLAEERPRATRHLADLLKLQPPQLERDLLLFETAVGGMGLERDGYAAGMQKLPKQMMLGAPMAPEPVHAPRRDIERAARDRNQDALRSMQEKSREAVEADKELRDDAGRRGFFKDDRSEGRKPAASLYRRLEPTKEWAENNYYKLLIEEQLSDLVPVNSFWADYAQLTQGRFLSRHIAQATSNFTEAMLALALTDLPFEAPKHEVKFEDGAMSFTPGGPVIAFHEEVRPVPAPAGNAVILVNQNFFRADDRYREEEGERQEKFVTEEFVVQTVYGGQVVVTNSTPSRQRLMVLVQVPVGAVPLSGGRHTRGIPVSLEPYTSKTLDYFFYFPLPGQFEQLPVQVAKNETLAAAAAPFRFNVVAAPSKPDTESWDYVSQNGSTQQVLDFLERNNVQSLDLNKIAWRMKEADTFRRVTQLLRNRHLYDDVLWSYAILHNDPAGIRQYLAFNDRIAKECGGPLESPIASFNPVLRHDYQHLEYQPLVNARIHQLGRRRQIVNDRFHQQYHAFLTQLSYRSTLNDEERLALVYYLLLQDRISEALAAFRAVNAANVLEKLQYDYCAAYLAMFSDDPRAARTIAERHAAHPVDRWRFAFAEVLAQLDEIDGKPSKANPADNRMARQTEEAARQPSFDLTLNHKAIELTWQNLESVTINYYLMDVELLFSRNPFVQQTSGQFSFIQPNAVRVLKLPAGQQRLVDPLPEDMVTKNVLVEVAAAGKTRSVVYYANAMDVQISDAFGQVRVAEAATGKPLAKVYVKCYVRSEDGRVKFHKDGYTDHRGRFDYASVSTPERSPPAKFALLILSEQSGAVIREVDPPQQ